MDLKHDVSTSAFVAATTRARMTPRLAIGLGALALLVLVCTGYAILHEFCVVEARWLYR